MIMEEMAVIGDNRFGDEQSSLFDQFERMSMEAHLNRAMLGRSLSESRLMTQVKQPRRRGPGFHKVLNKLLGSILGMKSSSGSRKQALDPEYSLSWKGFSRSLRF